MRWAYEFHRLRGEGHRSQENSGACEVAASRRGLVDADRLQAKFGVKLKSIGQRHCKRYTCRTAWVESASKSPLNATEPADHRQHSDAA
jgi:hypothetical protein